MTTATAPRITARVDENTQELLSKAAALAGMPSINSFVVSAAVEKARQVVEHEQQLRLNESDALMLAEALDQPAQKHDKLTQAAQRYQESQQ